MMPANDKNRFIAPNQIDDTRRNALTTLEFVACSVAVVGGAWLGALYLGVDVRHLAHTALTEAELLDNVPPKWRPRAPKDNDMSRDQLVASLREELGDLRAELTSLRSGSPDGTPEQATPPTDAPAGEEKTSARSQASKDETLTYWKRISEIALHEAALQQDAESASNEQNAAKVFGIKARISRFAVKSVEAVPNEAVDDSVVQFGQQLSNWYEQGGELYDRAARIWEMPVDSQSREQHNQEWRRADMHHRNEARLLNEKAIAVRGTVSRRFGTEFPTFAKPIPAADASAVAPPK